MKSFLARNFIFGWLLLTLCCANCATTQNSTPTAALKSYLAAANKKDVAAMKMLLSNGTLELTEENALAQNKSVDEMIKADAERSINLKVHEAETRNEIITGDEGSLEIKNAQTGGWDKLYFAKENGAWKIAIDKMMREMLKGVEENN